MKAPAASTIPVPGYELHEGFTVLRADTELLKECVYRLRYYVYVCEMQRTQIYVNHNRRTVCEPMDEHGANYLAILDGHLVGTVRRNLLDDPSTGYYEELYRTHLFDMRRADKLAITTKLMVLPQHQGSSVAMQLLCGFAEFEFREGIVCNIMDCNDYLVPLFERLGYFSYMGFAEHKEYGHVMPMFYAVDALEYLTSIKSCLAPISAAHCKDGEYSGYDLIRRLAQPPAREDIRRASEPYRRAQPGIKSEVASSS
jgi:GNAT superfamily N-acetyltransferase